MKSLDVVEKPDPLWIGCWLDDLFGFERGPAVRLEGASLDALRELAQSRGLPWTP